MAKQTKKLVREERLPKVVTREVTLNLKKRLFGTGIKKRAPRSVREIKKYVRKEMRTSDVRIDPELNKYLWSRGIKNPPARLRLRMARRRNEDEDAPRAYYTLVSYVPVATFSGLTDKVIEEEQ
eukprot:GEZU01000747.1.p2 GENE.GEZU01000747.1~~GEZU01000747.1.p2  ORF type:complete len:124 (+),score=51.22 GEZU01000747.1:119-490(+)